MLKCIKCGTKNSALDEKCKGCGTRLFFGANVIKTYKYSTGEKIILSIGKYLFLLVSFLLLGYGVYTIFCISSGSFLDNLLFGSIVVIPFAIGSLVSYLIYKLLDFAIKSSDHPESK